MRKLCVRTAQEGLDRAGAGCSEPYKVHFVDSEGKSSWGKPRRRAREYRTGDQSRVSGERRGTSLW